MPNITRALKIKGWMLPEELEWLANAAQDCQRILELGPYRGRSTRALLDNSNAHLWCVDTWDSRIFKETYSSTAQYNSFLRNIADSRARVTVLRMTTKEATAHMPPELFDLVFIDADHTYEWVRHDILAYAPRLRSGGVLSGHDYFHRAPGLMRAVDELIGKGRFALAHHIWWTEVGDEWLFTRQPTN